jgi:threonine synthase
MNLSCTQCEREHPDGTLGRCNICGGILQVNYSDDLLAQLAEIHPGPGIDRYRALMPVTAPLPSLGEGDTPLLKSRRIGKALGLQALYLKYEGCNPTGSFKDRAAVLVGALAREAGAAGVLTASSGNAAAAISAYSAAAGFKCVVLLEPDSPPTKLRQILANGARVVPVEGLFASGPEAVNDLLSEVAQKLNYYLGFAWAPVNPFILEAVKTISYEIVSRLPGVPEVVVSPVGGGDLLTAQWRGFKELKRAGLIGKLPRMIGVQSEQAPPLLKAFRAGAEKVYTLPFANSKLSGLNVPFSGEHALAAIRESGGTAFGVADEDVFAMQRRVALTEGLWIEPVSAISIAALAGLLERGKINAGEKVVCVMSGAGFKDPYLAKEQSEVIAKKLPVTNDVNAIVESIQK